MKSHRRLILTMWILPLVFVGGFLIRFENLAGFLLGCVLLVVSGAIVIWNDLR